MKVWGSDELRRQKAATVEEYKSSDGTKLLFRTARGSWKAVFRHKEVIIGGEGPTAAEAVAACDEERVKAAQEILAGMGPGRLVGFTSGGLEVRETP